MAYYSKASIFLLLYFVSFFTFKTNASQASFQPGKPWFDNNAVHINAHGGGVIFHDGMYYWFGEHRESNSFTTQTGVRCYSSEDLYNWKDEGVALSVVDNKKSPIQRGCIIERPKVIYNERTKQFVMYFHLELKGKGYAAAQVGVAVSDRAVGPYKLMKAERINSKKWPLNMTKEQVHSTVTLKDVEKWWTADWRKAVDDGLFVRRDFKNGQMSRDMTLFVDDDGTAYHIYSSEENLTIQIAELTDDYLAHTGRYIRVEPGGHNEAPALFKRKDKYYMITSGCTGWDPNEARLLVAEDMLGEWKPYPNPSRGKGANVTFNSQSTFILPINGKEDTFIFMADRWNPKNLKDSRYIWLPVLFENDMPILKYFDEWSLSLFDELRSSSSTPEKYEGWQLVWHDEFNYDGVPDPKVWRHENGFARNKEDQWYQPENAICKNGVLFITGQQEHRLNPMYEECSNDWRKKRKFIRYSASSINTRGTKEFQYGRFEVRAKIPTSRGAWPAIWTLGTDMEWPSNGEIDMLEFYQINNKPHILANAAWGTEQKWNAKWQSKAIPYSCFTDRDLNWTDKFHVWRMDWDEEAIRLYLDDELLNEILLSNTKNGSLGDFRNPFMQPHYILLNLAIGGMHGGQIDESAFPLYYEIDYVRVYQRDK